jgi:threonine/homoserine/homoserine lactone efflux protein
VVPFDRLAAFAAVSLLLIVIPGPSVLFVVGRALAHGRRTALLSVLGNSVGAFVLVVAVSMGVGPLVERSVLLFTALKLAGACYLVFLGAKAVRHRESLRAAFAADAPPPRGGARTVWEGFVVCVANPKTMVFFAAVLPQFTDRGNGRVTLQLLLLGLVFTGIALVSDSLWGLVASTARSWFARSPRRLSLVGGAGGLAMIGLGLTVAVTGRKD